MTRIRSALTPAQRMQKRRIEQKAELKRTEAQLSTFLDRAGYKNNVELFEEMRKTGMSFVTPGDQDILKAAKDKMREIRRTLLSRSFDSESNSDSSCEHVRKENVKSSKHGNDDDSASTHISDSEKSLELDFDASQGTAPNFDASQGNTIDVLTVDEQIDLAERTFPVPRLRHDKKRRVNEILEAGSEYLQRQMQPGPSSSTQDAFEYYRSGPRYMPTRPSYAEPDYLFNADPAYVHSTDPYFFHRYYVPAKKARVEAIVEEAMNVNLMNVAANYNESHRGTFHLDDFGEREELTRDMLQDDSIIFENDDTVRETVEEKMRRRHDYTFKKHDDFELYDQVDADDEGAQDDDEDESEQRIDYLLGTVTLNGDADHSLGVTYNDDNVNGNESDIEIEEVNENEENDSRYDNSQGSQEETFSQDDNSGDYHFKRGEKSYQDVCNEYLKEMQEPSNREKNLYLERTFLSDCSNMNLSERASRIMWDKMRVVRNNYPFNRKLQCYQTIRNRLLRLTPTVKMRYEIREKNGSNKLYYNTGYTYPQRKFPQSKYETLSVWTYSTVEDIYRFHKMLHKESTSGEPYMKNYDLCMDGVPLSVSGIDQMTILCLRFEGCKEVYTNGVFIHRRYKESCVLRMLQSNIRSAYAKCFYLRYFIADAPMRAKVKGLKGHNGFCSCDRCFASGVTLKKSKAATDGKREVKRRVINEDYEDPDDYEPPRKLAKTEIDDDKKGSNVLYPKDTIGMKRRTHSHFLDIHDKLRANEGRPPLPDKVAFGVKSVSVLTEDPGVDLVESCDIEPFHNLGLGMAKKIINCVVEPKKGEETFSKANKEIVDAFDEEWADLAIPCEFNRRPRKMGVSLTHFKAEEYISIATCGFLAFANAMSGANYKLMRQAWILFCYLLMAALLPQEEYDRLVFLGIHLEQLHRTFYDIFQKAFKLKNCTYNTHVFYHLPEVRKRKRLDEISAEPFEASFQYIKMIITNNTCSFSKTLMQKCFIHNFVEHDCRRNVYISSKNRLSKSADTTIYARHEGSRDFFEVFEVRSDTYICKKYETEKYWNDDVPILNWDSVGVRRVVSLQEDEMFEIPKKDVIGKGVRYRSILINVSFSTLHM